MIRYIAERAGTWTVGLSPRFSRRDSVETLRALIESSARPDKGQNGCSLSGRPWPGSPRYERGTTTIPSSRESFSARLPFTSSRTQSHPRRSSGARGAGDRATRSTHFPDSGGARLTYEQKVTAEGLDVLGSPRLRTILQREMALKRWLRLDWKELRDTEKTLAYSCVTSIAHWKSVKKPEPEPAHVEIEDPCEPNTTP